MPFDVQNTTVRGHPVLDVRGELDLAHRPRAGRTRSTQALAEQPAAAGDRPDARRRSSTPAAPASWPAPPARPAGPAPCCRSSARRANRPVRLVDRPARPRGARARARPRPTRSAGTADRRVAGMSVRHPHRRTPSRPCCTAPTSRSPSPGAIQPHGVLLAVERARPDRGRARRPTPPSSSAARCSAARSPSCWPPATSPSCAPGWPATSASVNPLRQTVGGRRGRPRAAPPRRAADRRVGAAGRAPSRPPRSGTAGCPPSCSGCRRAARSRSSPPRWPATSGRSPASTA